MLILEKNSRIQPKIQARDFLITSHTLTTELVDTGGFTFTRQ